MHRPAGEILAAMSASFSQVYIPNVEAVYKSSSVQHCFAETSTMNRNRYKFTSYANGKAAVRTLDQDEERGNDGDGVHPAGPHQWRTRDNVEPRSIHLEDEPFGPPLMVVHFESCPLLRWEDKYWELGNTSPEKVRKIPFKFYRDSITMMERCKAIAQTGP